MGSSVGTLNANAYPSPEQRDNVITQSDQSEAHLSTASDGKMAAHKTPERTMSMQKQHEKEDLMKKYGSKFNSAIKTFENCARDLRNKMDEKYYKEVYNLLETKIDGVFNKYKETEQRRFLGDKLAELQFVKAAVDYYVHLFDEELDIEGVTVGLVKESETSDDPEIKLILTIRTILWNFSDSSGDFGAAICETRMLQYLMKDLREINSEGITNLQPDDQAFVSALGILHNCARTPAPKTCFRDVDAVKHLLPFLKSDEKFIKLITLLCLAHIIDEEEYQYLAADDTIFDMLLDMIKRALQEQDHRSYGFSVHELVDGLTGLAKEEKNKKLIMDKGAHPLLKEVLKGPSEEEQLVAVRALRELAFREENKVTFLNDAKLVDDLQKLGHSKNEELAKSANGICFDLKEKDKAAPLKEQVSTVPVSGLTVPDKQKKGAHIMISYQWGNQKMILYLRDRLRDLGFGIWIDVEAMSGSIMDAMAQAIEDSAAVMMCMSEKYKLSQNCRTEAEYAYKLQKPIIPLVMELGYRPNGWLGLVLGSKLFFDFSGKYDFERKFQDLMKELGDLGKVESPRKPLNPPPPPPPPPAHDIRSAAAVVIAAGRPVTAKKKEGSLSAWKQKDVETWLKESKLESPKQLKMVTGEQLEFLRNVSKQAPEFYYRCLETKLSLSSLEDIMRFTKALEKLPE